MTKKEKFGILEEFHNSVGHALIDYYLLEGLDHIDKRQIERKTMEQIKLADSKAIRLIEALNQEGGN